MHYKQLQKILTLMQIIELMMFNDHYTKIKLMNLQTLKQLMIIEAIISVTAINDMPII